MLDFSSIISILYITNIKKSISKKKNIGYSKDSIYPLKFKYIKSILMEPPIRISESTESLDFGNMSIVSCVLAEYRTFHEINEMFESHYHETLLVEIGYIFIPHHNFHIFQPLSAWHVASILKKTTIFHSKLAMYYSKGWGKTRVPQSNNCYCVLHVRKPVRSTFW